MYRFHRVPATLGVLLLFSAAFAQPVLRDAVTRGDVPGARLRLSAGYLALAPFCDTADALTQLTVAQHVALLLTVLIVAALWRTRERRNRVRRAAKRVVLALAVTLGFYVLAVLAPHPMARVELTDPTLLAADFHAHTNASGDTRRSWTPERARRWHRRAGFAVAYVTDHRTVRGAVAARRRNPRRAGQGTVLLSGVEVRSNGEHITVLGTTGADSSYFRGRTISPDSLASFRPADGAPAVITLAHPKRPEVAARRGEIDAAEIVNAAPQGLQSSGRNRAAILRASVLRRWPLLAGSDNHGWGSTAVAWSLLRIPGWRAMTPDSLDRAIRRGLLQRGAVRSIERRRLPIRRSPVHLAATGPEAAWLLARSLSWPERLSWFAWAVLLWGAAWLLRQRPLRIPPHGGDSGRGA